LLGERIEEKCRNVRVVPLFLKTLRRKVAQLVQYGTFPLQNIVFLEGAHPIAAELCTSCATFPLSAKRKSGLTGTVRQLSSTEQRLSGRHSPDCRRVMYQLCHFPSKRLEEKWHNWYNTALFLYKTSAFWKALTRLPQSYVRVVPLSL